MTAKEPKWIDLNTKLLTPESPKDIRNFDLKALKTSLINILNIRIKELPGRPEFGNTLYSYLFQQITDEMNYLFKNDVRLMLRRWEPRIRIETCELIENRDYNEVICNVNFWIVDDPQQELFNLKTSFYQYKDV